MKTLLFLSVLFVITTIANAEKSYTVPIKQFKLKNGLRVILSQDNSAPIVGVCVMYDVGSRNEVKGRTGFAHLFEHMMFQGSENVGKAQHMVYVEAVGGSCNGSTAPDSTQYYETVPSSNLETALWLESDRMRSLAVTQDNLKNQQEVVKEEKRMRYDNQPYANARQKLSEMSYSNFANKHPNIGYMDDLNAATIEDVRAFFNTYYTPNNAVLSIAGKFNEREAMKMVKKYFETIKVGPPPPPVNVDEEVQSAETRDHYSDPLAKAPALTIAYRIPKRMTADNDAMHWIESILLSGTTSRAHQELVKKQQIVLSINGGADARRGPGLFTVFMMYRPEQDVKAVEAAFNEQVKLLQTDLISEAEYVRIKTRIKSSKAFQRVQAPMSRAQELARYAIFDGDPNLINTADERLLSVTREQIRDAAKKYLTESNRNVLVIEPITEELP